jgi:hypothetical protein
MKRKSVQCPSTSNPGNTMHCEIQGIAEMAAKGIRDHFLVFGFNSFFFTYRRATKCYLSTCGGSHSQNTLILIPDILHLPKSSLESLKARKYRCHYKGLFESRNAQHM